MREDSNFPAAILSRRVLVAFAFCSVSGFLAICSLAANPTGGWSIVTSPNVGTASNYLYGVTCTSASDCWAVGYPFNNGTLIERWDGSSWAIVTSPNSGAGLFGVTCASALECWAVGYYNNSFFATLIERWDGASWTIVPSADIARENNVLSSVTCSSASDCWAVGEYFDDASRRTLIERWNGSAWTIVASPNVSNARDNVLSSVVCPSASDCWAVGYFYGYFSAPPSKGPPHTLIEHWDGNSWSIVASPNSGAVQENYLNSIACSSASDCCAVGYYGGSASGSPSQTLIERWDGASWTIANSPNVSTAQYSFLNILNSVTCASASECWAVGYSYTGGPDQTLIERWDGSSWSIVGSPNIGGTSLAVTCASASECWAVGWYTNGNVGQTLIEEYSLTVPPLTSVVSRMTHGSAGPFDIDLPLTGTHGVECRSSASLGAGNYAVVFTFVNNVTSCGTAGTTGGSVSSGPNANQCTENLTGVADRQYTTVTLNNVLDSQNNTGNVSATMGVLIGDVNASGVVTSGDTNLCKGQALQPVTNANFRNDINASGAITTGDANIVKQNALSQLPSPP